MTVFFTAPGQITLPSGESKPTVQAIRELRQVKNDIGALDYLIAHQLVKRQGDEYVPVRAPLLILRVLVREVSIDSHHL
jgi:hypothetical protein